MSADRRHFLQSGAAAAVALMGTGSAASPFVGRNALGFTSVPASLLGV